MPEHCEELIAAFHRGAQLFGQRLRATFGGPGAQQRAQRREQLGRLERLREIAIRTRVEPQHLVLRRDERRRGQDDDDARGARVFAEPFAHLDAIEIGELDVEQHDIDIALTNALERLHAVDDRDDLESFARQELIVHVARNLAIVDVEDADCFSHDYVLTRLPVLRRASRIRLIASSRERFCFEMTPSASASRRF